MPPYVRANWFGVPASVVGAVLALHAAVLGATPAEDSGNSEMKSAAASAGATQ